MFLILMQYNSSENDLVVVCFEKLNLKGGGGGVLVSTIEVKALYIEIFLDSTYDMKFKFKPVITADKGVIYGVIYGLENNLKINCMTKLLISPIHSVSRSGDHWGSV